MLLILICWGGEENYKLMMMMMIFPCFLDIFNKVQKQKQKSPLDNTVALSAENSNAMSASPSTEGKRACCLNL